MKIKTVLKTTLAGQFYTLAKHAFSLGKRKEQPPALSLQLVIPESSKPFPAITLYGTGFSNVTTANIVKLNDTQGIVTMATPNQLVVSFISGVTKGIISVTVGGITVQAACDFIIHVAEESRATIL